MPKNNKENLLIAFDAQNLMQPKTGIGYYTIGLIQALARSSPSSLRMVGHCFSLRSIEISGLDQEHNVRFVRTFIPVRIINLLRRLGLEMPFELLVRERSDVLLFPNYLSFPSITRRPTISIVYDLAFLDCPEYVSVKNRNDLVRFVPVSIKRSSIVITISMSMRDRIIHYYPEATSKIIVVPVPAAHNKVIPSKLPINLTSRGLAPGRYILHVGTIEPRKNIESLVEAYACLPQNVRNSYALVLAGGNGWKNESIVAAIKKQQAAGLNIIQTGYVGDAVKSALYQHAACFVMPSHYEGFGMPIFEAFQRSIPVAASDIPVFREIAADAVSYFNKDNPRDISRVLTGLLQDEALQKQLVARGKERLGAYSWPENARIVTEAFERLLN